MAKKTKTDKALKAVDNLYTDCAIVNLGDNPREVQKKLTGRPSIDFVTDGGFPVGRLILVAGKPSVGKSSLLIQIAEKVGKKILYVDTERTLTTSYIKALGAHPSNFNHVLPTTTEEMCNTIRKQIPEYDVIIVDSINNSASEEQFQKKAEERTMANRAIVFSAQIPILIGMADQHNTTLFFLSQIRDNMNKANKYSPDTVIPGGNSLHHNSSLTIELFPSTKTKVKGSEGLSNKQEIIEGNAVRIKCTKNKVGKANREVTLDFTYGKGYEEQSDVISAAVQFGILEQKGAWVKYQDENIAQGKVKLLALMKEDKSLYNEIKEAVDFELNEILSQ